MTDKNTQKNYYLKKFVNKNLDKIKNLTNINDHLNDFYVLYSIYYYNLIILGERIKQLLFRKTKLIKAFE